MPGVSRKIGYPFWPSIHWVKARRTDKVPEGPTHGPIGSVFSMAPEAASYPIRSRVRRDTGAFRAQKPVLLVRRGAVDRPGPANSGCIGGGHRLRLPGILTTRLPRLSPGSEGRQGSSAAHRTAHGLTTAEIIAGGGSPTATDDSIPLIPSAGDNLPFPPAFGGPLYRHCSGNFRYTI